MGDHERKKKKKEGSSSSEDKEHVAKRIGSSTDIKLVVTDTDGTPRKKKKHHKNDNEGSDDEPKEHDKEKRKKKKKSENGNDDSEEKEQEKEGKHHKKDSSGGKGKEGKDSELLEKLEKRKKERAEKKANTLKFRRSFKGNTTGTVILPPKSASHVQVRSGPTYAADDMDATSPRKKHSSLENTYSGPKPTLSLDTLRAEENKPDKLSRWASLKGIRDGFLRSPLGEESRRNRSYSGPTALFEGTEEETSTSNPLVALAQRQQQLELKKEREILSESPNLDERTLMRHRVINELINTERDYINDLNRVIKLFLEPLGKEGILTTEELKDIFSNVKLLVNVNNALLDDLWKQAKDTNGEELGQSFVLLSHYLKMYSQYCGNQKVSREAVANAMKTNNKFKAFIEKQTTLPELNNLTLKDFLIKPVQRLCKYPLLLRELLKYTDETHPDYEKLKAAFEAIQEAVESVNAQKQTEEEMEEVAEMLSTLTGAEKFGVQLMVPGRKFVKEGVVKTTTKDHSTNGTAHYYMFSDLLILAEDCGTQNGDAGKRKSSKKGGPSKREVLAMLPFGMCLLNKEVASDDGNGLKHLVEIIQSKNIHTFYFDSATEKEEWANSLRIEDLNGDSDDEKEKKSKSKQKN